MCYYTQIIKPLQYKAGHLLWITKLGLCYNFLYDEGVFYLLNGVYR